MDTSQVLIVVSILCDLVLFALFGWLFWRIRALSGDRLQELIDQLKESQELAKRLQALVEEKARLAKRLEATLKDGSEVKKGEGAASDTHRNTENRRERVLELMNKGLGVSEISEATGMSAAEVEFILAVQKVRPGS